MKTKREQNVLPIKVDLQEEIPFPLNLFIPLEEGIFLVLNVIDTILGKNLYIDICPTNMAKTQCFNVRFALKNVKERDTK